MIAKTLLNQSFEATLRYVFKPDAILIDTNEPTAGVSPNPRQIADSMNQTACGRSSKPCYHIALSPHPTDSILPQDWKQLGRDFLSRLGLSSHQTVVVLHRDSLYEEQSRPHLHFVINRYYSSDPSTKAACLHFPQVERVVRQLEKAYQLQAVPCSWEVRQRGDSPPQYHCTEREQVPSIRHQLQTTIDQARQLSTSLEEFTTHLESAGVTVNRSPQGWSFEMSGFHFAGYQLGQAYTGKQIEKSFGMANQQTEETPSEASVRSSSMADVFRAANKTPAQIETPTKSELIPELIKETGQTLDRLGQHIGSHQEGVDGMAIGGATVRLTGATVTLAQAFFTQLEAARQQSASHRAQALLDQLEEIDQRTETVESAFSFPPNSLEATQQEERFQNILNHLEKLGDRTSDLENTFADFSEVRSGETHSTTEIDSSVETPIQNDPLETCFNLAGERLEKLEEKAGLPLINYQPIHFDRTASIDQQLDQMEAAVQQLFNRLSAIESVVLHQESPLSQETPTTGETLAESLHNFIQARSQYWGVPPTEAISTRTLGTIGFSNQGDDIISVSEVGQYGAKFEAVKLQDGKWEVVTNDLSDLEKQSILRLPQSVEAYTDIANTQAVIRHFQKSAPEQFTKDQGGIIWKDEKNQASYVFAITTNEDGSKTVIGTDNRTEKPILKARIATDGRIQVEQGAIPQDHAESLFDTLEKPASKSQTKSQSPETPLHDFSETPAQEKGHAPIPKPRRRERELSL